MSPPRLVSLLPGCTEIVCGLGLANHLVGRSHECDFPPSVRALPVCTAPKVATRASSREIDRQVKTLLHDARSIYRIDTAKLKELRPDVILTQSQCEACAVSLAEVEQAVCDWTGVKPRILSLAPRTLAEVWDTIMRVADALGARRRGEEWVAHLKLRLEAITTRAGRISSRPTVACVEWLDPLMAAGNWVPELVSLAGGQNLFGEPGKHSPWLNWETLRERDPDIIVVMPCGFDLARTRAELPALTRLPGWKDLQAVKNRKVYLTDGNQYFNRSGPRLVESLEILAEMLHPDIFDFGHPGGGWEKSERVLISPRQKFAS